MWFVLNVRQILHGCSETAEQKELRCCGGICFFSCQIVLTPHVLSCGVRTITVVLCFPGLSYFLFYFFTLRSSVTFPFTQCLHKIAQKTNSLLDSPLVSVICPLLWVKYLHWGVGSECCLMTVFSVYWVAGSARAPTGEHFEQFEWLEWVGRKRTREGRSLVGFSVEGDGHMEAAESSHCMAALPAVSAYCLSSALYIRLKFLLHDFLHTVGAFPQIGCQGNPVRKSWLLIAQFETFPTLQLIFFPGTHHLELVKLMQKMSKKKIRCSNFTHVLFQWAIRLKLWCASKIQHM